MINSKEILADFIFAGNRVSSFSLDTKDVGTKGVKIKLAYDFDFTTKYLEKTEEEYIGTIEFLVSVKAKIKKSILF